ncbi:hypothetical protein [Methylophaga pinxianii]|uniref:hypothetical protein n=1 Tax=Methylophaga pinxianii TaxID=2881052 RepID=UPI001CF4E072|nr:hypothetical protein [Methylophaga pinxianii]MCB2426676.1 hypothetical protein [Methylophaga pinxianii]UPH44484.1 hypothetical protein LGT42_008120 [Methylophaga pinxianii]
MDVMERLFFIALVALSLYMGGTNMVKETVFEIESTAAINELKIELTKKDEEINKLNIELGKINDQFSLITNLSDEAREMLAASKLAENIAKNQSLVNELTAIIKETPEEAITLSLMKGKFERDQIELNGKLEAVKARLEEVKSNNSVLIGFIAAFFIYIIGFHFNHRAKSKNVQQKHQADT